MTAGKQRLTSRPWRRAVAGPGPGVLAMGLLLAASSCAQRSLVEVDVTGDSAFQAVTLRLIAGGTSKDFPSASFDTVTPFKAGLYLSDSVSGSVTVVANVLGGGGACIGAGQAAATGVASGAAVGPIALTVTHTSSCATTATGTGGASGGGTGGSSGGGTGGASGAGTGGASGGGTGGSSGGGTGGASGGGTGGSSGDGTGGASGGGTNLVTNGDFSNGTTGWGLPAMVGTVSALAVTNGALCVTLGSSSSATIGYPSGATPAFQINGGTSYTFSYQASSSGGATLEAKVGQTVPPYDATGSDWMNEAAGTSLQTFTHTFTRGATDGSMGVAFNVMGGPATVCIDNVSLTAN